MWFVKITILVLMILKTTIFVLMVYNYSLLFQFLGCVWYREWSCREWNYRERELSGEWDLTLLFGSTEIPTDN